MNKFSLLFLYCLFTFFSLGQTLKNNYVIGAQLPFLYNNDREKPDNDSSSSVSFSFRPRLNLYFQLDRYDPEQYGSISKFSMRVDYSFLQAQQNDDYSLYNHLHQISFLYLIGGMHKSYGMQVGAGPTFNFGDAQGINARLFLGAYGEWKRFIGSVDINFFIPNAKRKKGIASDSYKYGHFSVGIAYRL